MQSRRKLRFRLVVSFALFGFGLSALFAVAALNIRTRVEYLKGTVDIDSAPGRGTLVALHVPLD